MNIRQRLENNELVIGAFMKSSDPAMAEVLGNSVIDFFVLDNEHVSMNKESIANIIRAAEAYNVEPIIRVMKNEASNILQALDAGAIGVQVPNIDTPQDAKDLQDYARYKPYGKRGFSPNVRAARYGATGLQDYLKWAKENVLVVAHIESKEGYENLDEILKVEEINTIFIGPMDITQSFGMVGQLDDPLIKEVIKEITEKSLAAGKSVGTVCGLNAVKKYYDLGMRYMLVSNDQSTVLNYYKSVVKDVEAMCK